MPMDKRINRLVKFWMGLLLTAWVVILSAQLAVPTTVDDLDEISILTPIDTSSPRSTLTGFRWESQLAYQLTLEADQETQRTPGLRHSAAVLHKAKIAEIRMRRAMRYIDLSNTPEARRYSKGLRSAILLHEIFNRITLPPLEKIPDAENNQSPRIEIFAGIELKKITDGPRQGEYIFTQQTTARLETIYRLLHAVLPNTPRTDFYRFYIANPGRLLPPKWSYWLPGWTKILLGEQTLWQWAALVIMILGAIGLYWLVNRLQEYDQADGSSLRKTWKGLINPVTLLLLITMSQQVQSEINITGRLDDVLITAQGVLFFGALSWLFFMVMNGLGRTLIVAPKFAHQPLEAVMVRNGFRILGGLAAVTTLYGGFKHLGFDVAPMLAGIGAGSLALSFGIQPYLKNVIGGVTLLANRTMTIGEFCQIGGTTGVVEDIGLTSTCVRQADRSLVTLPNASIVDQEIINYSRRDRYVFTEELTLKRLSDGDIEAIIQTLKQVLATSPLLAHPQVNLVDLTPEQMTFAVTADVLTTNPEAYAAIQRELLQQLQSVG
ncbi:mechanosensitive ion channel family protein [Gloeomargarita lithophora]|nr:mechanosensitive ion channel domain-containing protein [Gloeomargarita lithophora]